MSEHEIPEPGDTDDTDTGPRQPGPTGPDASVAESAAESAAEPAADPDASVAEPAAESIPDHPAGAAVAHSSGHEDYTATAEGLGRGFGDHATGDIVIDAALQDLQAAQPDDLDAQIEAGQRVQSTLQARLSDLGGE